MASTMSLVLSTTSLWSFTAECSLLTPDLLRSDVLRPCWCGFRSVTSRLSPKSPSLIIPHYPSPFPTVSLRLEDSEARLRLSFDMVVASPPPKPLKSPDLCLCSCLRHLTGFHQAHRESEPPSFSPSRLSPPSQKLVPPFIAPPFPNPTSCRRRLLLLPWSPNLTLGFLCLGHWMGCFLGLICLVGQRWSYFLLGLTTSTLNPHRHLFWFTYGLKPSLTTKPSSAFSFSASIIVLPLLFPQVCSYHSLSDSSILGSYWMGVESVVLALWNLDLVLTISMIVDSGLILTLLMNFDPFGSPFVLSDGTLIALVRPFTAVCSPFTAVCSSFPRFILDIGNIKIGLLPLWHIGLTLLMSIHPVNLVDFSSVEYVPKGFVPFIRMCIYGFVDVAWEVQSLFRAEPPHFGTRRQVLFPKFPLVWSGLDDQALVAEFVTLWVALDAVTREAFGIVLFRSPLVFVVELYFQSISILPYCSVLSCFSCIVILYFTFVMVVIPPLLSEVET